MAAAPAPRADLQLTLEGLRSTKGSVRLCLWTDGTGFPDCQKNQTVKRLETSVSATTVTLDVSGLRPGSYGISVIHDENDNHRLDKSFIGLPTEGVGFSNNASASFGPPKFRKVSFTVSGDTSQTIKMRYYL